ncbi:MAG TPA: MBL fold metallo-hydrolase [Candidatus Omnitrophota bacterium]|nr:MBL fold metallo-hydrolase [Candidatus Omnitrophota bacterium]
MDLMAKVAATQVAPGTMALWFLGQNGWLVKSPAGIVLAVDPYLTDSCHPSRRGLDLRRRVPVPVAPAELAADLLACTHSHKDHADVETLTACAASGRIKRFMGPAETQAVFAAAGVPEAARALAWPNQVTELGDLRLTGTFALPTDTTDLTHMGLLVEVVGGPKLWITGDTQWCDLLADNGAQLAPDAMAVCINGGYANLSHWQAAELVARVNPRIAIPCHWDMFADNSCDPRMFWSSLTVKGIGDKYRKLDSGEGMVI